MAILVNRAKMTTATTGTGTLTLGSAVSGYQSFADAGVTDADVVRYVIEDGSNWEIGEGTYTASGTTLSRTVLESSNADAAISLSGDATVFVTAVTEDIQQPPVEGAFVDGDKTKLDGIEALADVTDTANVTAAGALMDSEVTNLADVKAFDPADYAVADGDVLDITFTPTNYTPDTTPAEVSDVDDLAAHLKGIDTALSGAGGGDLAHATTTGAAQTVSFDNDYQTVDTGTNATVTLSFSSTKAVEDVTVIVDATDAPGAWDLSNATYDRKSFDLSAVDSSPDDIFFKPDGTKMYFTGSIDAVRQYTLLVPWDISTASYDAVFDVSAQETSPDAIFFKPDGTKLYVVGGNSTVYQYTLSTAWDISTTTYDTVSFSVSAQATGIEDVIFKPDGTKMYVVSDSTDTAYQYTLSTAWDVSTATYDSKSFDFGTQDTSPCGIWLKPDGTKMYMLGHTNDTVYQYTLSTAWDISTASYDSLSFGVAEQEDGVDGFYFRDDGRKMYVLGFASNAIHQYSLVDISLVFPAALEVSYLKPPYPKSVYTFVTVDSGTSYQLVSKSEQIT